MSFIIYPRICYDDSFHWFFFFFWKYNEAVKKKTINQLRANGLDKKW